MLSSVDYVKTVNSIECISSCNYTCLHELKQIKKFTIFEANMCNKIYF